MELNREAVMCENLVYDKYCISNLFWGTTKSKPKQYTKYVQTLKDKKFLGFSRCRNVIWEIVAEILIVAGKKFWSSTEDTDKKGPFHQENFAKIQDTRYSRGWTWHMGLETEFNRNLVPENSNPPLIAGDTF